MKGLEKKKVTSRHAKWVNDKFKKREYRGHYEKTKSDRVFSLCTKLKNGKAHVVSFDSHEAAKKAGWKRLA